jgi:hypothetical protein
MSSGSRNVLFASSASVFGMMEGCHWGDFAMQFGSFGTTMIHGFLGSIVAYTGLHVAQWIHKMIRGLTQR